LNLLFAWRYFKAPKSTNAINLISWISITAIAVGTAALIIVLSVFNGFEHLVKGLYSDFYADVQVRPAKGKLFTVRYQQLQAIQQLNGVQQVSTALEEKALLVHGDYQSIVFIKGVARNYEQVIPYGKHLLPGSKQQLGSVEQPSLIVGAGVQNAIGANTSGNDGSIEPYVIYLPNKEAKQLDAASMLSSNVQLTGAFMIQQEFDDKYAFTNIQFLQYMLGYSDSTISTIEIKLQPNANSDAVIKNIRNIVGEQVTIQTRYQQNQSLYSVMQMEKWVIYGILSLILIVAAFNMIGALTMLVLEKQRDITLLQAIGASAAVIRNIFISAGLFIAGLGAGIGMLLAYLILLLQLQFKLVKLQGGSFLIDYYPVRLLATDFLLVSTTLIAIALLASWIPAVKASKQAMQLKSA